MASRSVPAGTLNSCVHNIAPLISRDVAFAVVFFVISAHSHGGANDIPERLKQPFAWRRHGDCVAFAKRQCERLVISKFHNIAPRDAIRIFARIPINVSNEFWGARDTLS
jgi:hypothetical protein